MTTTNLKDLYNSRRESIVKDYFKLLSFPSVSSEAEYTNDVLACADWLVDSLKKIGFDTELWKTEGHPTIFASHLKAGPNKPTLLIYNHYDVQPVDPLELWRSPPFQPTEKEGVIYARGAQDNKGQCTYVIQALKALIEQDKALPINVKLCIEGEEENGSTGLSGILRAKKDQLKADYLAIVDAGLRKQATPTVTLGFRGIVTMDVEAQCSSTDLHSGSHGGMVYNPIHALVEILSKLRDSSGRITIPGFYDGVEEFKTADKAALTLAFDPVDYKNKFGATPTGGEKKYSPLERAWMRPTIEINGINGGYTGSGFKTVIPAKASAKVSCRLVPNQDPEQVGKLVAQYIEQLAPEGVHVTATIRPGGGKPIRALPESHVVKAFARAYAEVFQAPCEFIFEGGSIPVISELALASGAEIVLLGMGLADDNIHAPNEHFGLDRLEQGFLVIARALQILGE